MRFKEKKEPVKVHKKKTFVDNPSTNAANSLELFSDDELIDELVSRGYSGINPPNGNAVFTLKIVPVEGKVKRERYSSELLALRAYLEYQRRVPENFREVSLSYDSGSSERELQRWPLSEKKRSG